MKFDVLTLFPEMFEPVKQSILGRAEENKLIEVNLINIRDFSENKHKKVDDTPYGGGAGMVMQADVIYNAYKSIKKTNAKVIYMSPQGQVLNQKKVEGLSKEEHLIILCGHYEGIDERALENIVTDFVSIGDYVLTGGELPAMVVIDTVSRLVPGVLNNEESAETESTMKKRIAEFRRTLEENEVLDTFDRYVFESIVEKVIVGGYDEDGNKDPSMLTFIYKTGFRNSLDGTNFKPPRKNSKAAKQNAGLCSHTTDEAKSMCSYHSDNTCGDGMSLSSEKSCDTYQH